MISKPATTKVGTPWEDGCIYVLKIPDCPDYVKIGRTKEDPDKRMNQLLKCGNELEVIDNGSYIKIPYHQRVEKIIHLDLRNRQHTFTCSCKQSKTNSSAHVSDGLTEHGEWFKIDVLEAIQTVNNWRDWMHQNPYDVDGNLKLEWKNRITVLSRDKTYHSRTIHEEDKAGKRWETFRSGPSVVKDLFFLKRQDSIGRPLDPRWERMCRNKGKIFTHCSAHWLVSWFLLEIVGSVYPSTFPWVYVGIDLLSSLYWL